MFENPGEAGKQEILQKNSDLKSSSEQVFSKNCRWVPLVVSPDSDSPDNKQHSTDYNSAYQRCLWVKLEFDPLLTAVKRSSDLNRRS